MCERRRPDVHLCVCRSLWMYECNVMCSHNPSFHQRRKQPFGLQTCSSRQWNVQISELWFGAFEFCWTVLTKHVLNLEVCLNQKNPQKMRNSTWKTSSIKPNLCSSSNNKLWKSAWQSWSFHSISSWQAASSSFWNSHNFTENIEIGSLHYSNGQLEFSFYVMVSPSITVSGRENLMRRWSQALWQLKTIK